MIIFLPLNESKRNFVIRYAIALVNQREVIHVKTITYLLEMWAFIVIQRDNAVKSSGWSLLDKQVFIAE